MTETCSIDLELPFGTHKVYVTTVTDTSFRLEENPLFCLSVDDESDLEDLPEYKDVFEAQALDDSGFRFVRVTERAGFKRTQFVVGSGYQVAALKPIFEDVIAAGGYWERLFHGIVIILVPPDSSYDPKDDIRRALRLKSWQRIVCQVAGSAIWPSKLRVYFRRSLPGYRF